MEETEGTEGRTYWVSDDNQKLVNFFRQHIDLFLGMDTGEVEYLIDIALEDEAGVSDLLKLIGTRHSTLQLAPRRTITDRQAITDILMKIKSDDRSLKIFKQAAKHGVTEKSGEISILTRLLISGDIPNVKLFLTILPDEIENITDIIDYPMISMIFLVNFYPHVISNRMFSNRRFNFDDDPRVKEFCLVECLLNIGYTFCYTGTLRDMNMDIKDFNTLIQAPAQNLFEIVLRQCRRNQVNLSALPLALNCINYEIKNTSYTDGVDGAVDGVDLKSFK